jgi:serine/threonine-protein kinase
VSDPPWRLGDRFDLLDQLGAGASGTLWRGRDAADGAEYAVKLLRPELVEDQDAVAELYAALNAVARLGHPGIVAVDNAVLVDGWLTLRSQLIHGESLSALLARQGTMASAQAVALIAQVCDALAAAHAVGIAHGSLHSANVLLMPGLGTPPGTSAQPMLTDFAMAALLNRADATREPVSASADVYAVGVLLYECLAGHTPFAAHPPTPIAGISDSLWQIVAGCLTEDPRYRPTAAQLAAALRSESSDDSTQLLSVVPGLSAAAVETRGHGNGSASAHVSGSGSEPGNARLPRVIAEHKTEAGIAAAVVVVSALIAVAMSMGGGGSTEVTARPAKSATPVAATSPTPQAVVLPSAPSPSASPSSSATASAPATGDMTFINTLTNKCMDTAGRVFADGTTEDIFDCNGTPAQVWTVTAAGQLTQDGGAFCLDDLGFGNTPGSKVGLWSCNGGANQQWTLHPDGSITGNYANLCLDVTGQGSSDGTPLVLWTCDGSPSQQWTRQ